VNRALIVAPALLLAGCTLLIDTDAYRGGRDGAPPPDTDGGTRDAAVDAGPPDPNAPTMPEVRIEPEGPVTSDDLTAVIVTESTDPLGGEVTYEYAWLRDDEDAGIATDTVSAEATADGETWRVEVTPVAGELRGPPGTASVTIGNRPPTIGYLGLETYRPIHGEVLQAFVGGTSDPDGDPVRVTYEWSVDGSVVDGETGPRLSIDEASMPEGAEVTVRAVPDDGTSTGDAVEAGPAVVLSDVTRWRQVLPHRSFRAADHIVFDPLGRRVLLIDSPVIGQPPAIWEHALDGDGGRFIELHPSGTPPELTLSRSVYDPINRRVVFFGGIDISTGDFSDALVTLDVSTRGAERWVSIAAPEPAPEARIFPLMGFDPIGGRVLVVGGGGPGETQFNDLWSLDVSREGFEAWTRHSTTVPDGAISGGLVVDPSRDRAVIVGGAVSSGGTTVPQNTILSADLDDLEAGFADTGVSFPVSISLPAVGLDAEGDRAIVAFGQTDGRADQEAVYALDLSTLAATPLDLGPATPSRGGAGFIEADPYGEGLVAYFADPSPDDRHTYSLYRLADSTLTPIHAYGLDAPPVVFGAAHGGQVFFGGETIAGERLEDLWEYDPIAGLQRLDPRPDEITSNTPGPRAHLGAYAARGLAPIGFHGGFGDDATPWRLGTDGSASPPWIERTLRTAAPFTPRQDAVHFGSRCGEGMFSGFDGTAVANTTYMLDCAVSGLRDCEWSALGESGPRPAARSAAAAGTTTVGDLLVFGGSNGTTVLDDLWLLDTCPPASWAELSPSGDSPEARSHHTLTDASSASGFMLLLVGGRAAGGAPVSSEVYRLIEASAGIFEWRVVNVPSGPNDAVLRGRWGHVAVYDPRLSDARLIVYGGRDEEEILGDLWELRIR